MIDDFNREALVIKIEASFPAQELVKTLDALIQWRGKPAAIRCDNGTEYHSDALKNWAAKQGISLLYIEKGCPQQNAYVERFNKTVRGDWLKQQRFCSTFEAQQKTEKWRFFYNHLRPNLAIGMPPKFLQSCP